MSEKILSKYQEKIYNPEPVWIDFGCPKCHGIFKTDLYSMEDSYKEADGTDIIVCYCPYCRARNAQVV